MLYMAYNLIIQKQREMLERVIIVEPEQLTFSSISYISKILQQALTSKHSKCGFLVGYSFVTGIQNLFLRHCKFCNIKGLDEL